MACHQRPGWFRPAEFLANCKIASVVDGHLRAQRLVFLEILFDLRVLIADMQRGHDPFSDHAGVESGRRAFGHTPVEDQTDPIRSTQIQVLPYQFFKYITPRQPAIEYLGQGKFGLQHRQNIIESCLTILL